MKNILEKLRKALILEWRGYVLAIVLVVIATWLKYLAQPVIIPADVPILYFLAIVPTAVFFGFGPSIMVCLLSVLAYDLFFIAPLNQIDILDIQNAPILTIFLLIGILFSYLTSNLRKKNRIAAAEIAARKLAEMELVRHRDHLEELVKQRTGELELANLALKDDIAERITAKKEREQLLNSVQQEKDRIAAVLNSITDEVWFFDTQGKISLMNPAAVSEFGFNTQNGLGIRDLIATLEVYRADGTRRSGEQNPAIRSLNGEIIKNEEEAVYNPANKETHYRQVSSAPVKNSGGQIIGAVCVVRDITERKKMEEDDRRREEVLRETRDYLDSLFNYANAPIIVWNPQFRITRFNHAFEDLTGYTSSEILGKNLEVLFPDDSRDESIKHILAATSGERWEVVEIPIKHKNGAVRILLWNSAAIYTPDDKTVIATIAQGQDITERKRVEQMKDEFIGLVSHELRTPLTVIIGSLRTALSEGLSPEDTRELVQNAAEGADSLEAILGNMLELSRHQTNRLDLRFEPVTIAAETRRVIEKLKKAGASHQFIMEIPSELPPVEADPTRVERILYNLLENATKYSPEGSKIKVSGRMEEDCVVTEVIDRGIGIDPDDQSRLFEPFQRLGNPSHAKGIGLGLVVSKRLVEAQHGWIKVDSELGKGSTFSFALPKHTTT
jgi:PAS domain S-box-containing protein